MKLSEAQVKSKASFTGVPSAHSAFSGHIAPNQQRNSSHAGGQGEAMNVTESAPVTNSHRLPHIEHTSAQKAALTAHGFSTQPISHQHRKQPRHPRRTAVNLVYRSTFGLVRTFKMVNPKFGYNEQSNPRRVLTKPSERGDNQGYDNKDHDYILYVHDIISGHRSPNRYQVLDLLGKGTFGQVVKCLDLETNEYVAVKIVKNLPAFHSQGLVEVKLLQTLNSKYDSDVFPMVRMLDNFVFRNHLCLVFELLNVSLYELIRQNQFRGLSVQLVSIFTKQILTAMVALHQSHIIHCDLKPENILLEDASSPNLKVIDFGSACFDNQAVYTYIQSRFYRSPEVILGLPYKLSIDIWSLGCIVFELFVGLPLFPGLSQHRMLMRFIKFLGMPPYKMLADAKDTSKFFNRVGHSGTISDYVLKTDDEYSRHIATLTGNKPIPAQPFRDYYKAGTIQQIVLGYDYKSGLTRAEREEEVAMRKAMLSFLDCVLPWEPEARWTPDELLTHPFVTGQPCPEGPLPRPSKALCNQHNPLLMNTSSIGSDASSLPSNRTGPYSARTSDSDSQQEVGDDDSSEPSYMTVETRSSSSGDSTSLPGSISTSSQDRHRYSLTSSSASINQGGITGTGNMRTGTTSAASGNPGSGSASTGVGAGMGGLHPHQYHHHHQHHTGSIPAMTLNSSAMSGSSQSSTSARAMSGPLVSTSKGKVPSLPGLGASPSTSGSYGQSPFFTKLGSSPRTVVAMDISGNNAASSTLAGVSAAGSDMLVDIDDMDAADAMSEGAASSSSSLSSPAHTMIELSAEAITTPEIPPGKRGRSKTSGFGGGTSSPSSRSGSGSSSKRQKHASAGSSGASAAGRRHNGNISAVVAQQAGMGSPSLGMAPLSGYSPGITHMISDEASLVPDDLGNMMDVAANPGMWNMASVGMGSGNASQFQRARLAGTDMMVDMNYMGGAPVSGSGAASLPRSGYAQQPPPQLTGQQRQSMQPPQNQAQANLFPSSSFGGIQQHRREPMSGLASSAGATLGSSSGPIPNNQRQQFQPVNSFAQVPMAPAQGGMSTANPGGYYPTQQQILKQQQQLAMQAHHYQVHQQPNQPPMQSGPSGAPGSFGKMSTSSSLDSSTTIPHLVGEFDDNLTFWQPGDDHVADFGVQQQQQQQQAGLSAIPPQNPFSGNLGNQSSFAAALSPSGPNFIGGNSGGAPGGSQFYPAPSQLAPGSGGGTNRRPFPSGSLAVPGGHQGLPVAGPSSYGSGSLTTGGIFPTTFGNLQFSPYDPAGHHFFSGSFSSSSSFAQPTLGSSFSSAGAPGGSGQWDSSYYTDSSYPSNPSLSFDSHHAYPNYSMPNSIPSLSSSFLVSPSSDPSGFLKRGPNGQPITKQADMSSSPNSRSFRRNQDAVP